ncbi:hypothetical protein L1987_60366 [Smallanthus sonchifolius]|uniref:Uncharacterized protein n=1 Tax=Smallanthus sonchifolius TaxID=185202 RepID=A0ACB9D7T1_9ASTR|nr:hypothetical protein L1987_60366 [Smallanthus sonchifolius]
MEKAIIATFSRKKSIPVKRKFKKVEEMVAPDPEKYAILYKNVENDNKKFFEHAAYLYEHGYKWERIFGMTEEKVEDAIGYNPEIIEKCSTGTLKRMTEKLGNKRAQREKSNNKDIKNKFKES